MNVQNIAAIALALNTLAAAPASAYPAFLSESDTGLIAGDLNCKITASEVDPDVTFSEDPFQYLHATVRASFTCVDRNGINHRYSGQDTVWFPLATFNWATQEWTVDGESVARRNPPYGIALTDGVETRVWTNVDEAHMSLKVELWK